MKSFLGDPNSLVREAGLFALKDHRSLQFVNTWNLYAAQGAGDASAG